jgi:Mrp family chromosome partitioning ATPase
MAAEMSLHGEVDPGRTVAPGNLVSDVLRFSKSILAAAVFVGLAVWGLSHLQPTMYQAKTQLTLSDPRSAGVFLDESRLPLDDFSRYLRTQAESVTSATMLERISAQLGGRLGSDQVRGQLSATVSTDVGAINITARDSTAAGARELADVASSVYQETVVELVQQDAALAQQKVAAERETLAAQLAEVERALVASPDDPQLLVSRHDLTDQIIGLDAEMQAIPLRASNFGSGVQRIEGAELPGAPYQPQPFRNGVLAGFLALLLAGFFGAWQAQRHPVVSHSRQIESLFGAPLLGVLSGRIRGGQLPLRPGPAQAADLRFAAMSLARSASERSAGVIMLTSVTPSGERTSVGHSVAVTLAQDERRVVLVDADLQGRGLSRRLGLLESRGLTDLGAGASWADCVSLQAAGQTSLPVIPAGSAVPRESAFFGTPQGAAALLTIRGQADLVIMDGPPVAGSPEVVSAASAVDAAVVYARRGDSVEQLEAAAGKMASTGCEVLGIIFGAGRSLSALRPWKR